MGVKSIPMFGNLREVVSSNAVLQDPVNDLVNGDGLSYQEPEPNLVITPSHTLGLLLGTLLSIIQPSGQCKISSFK